MTALVSSGDCFIREARSLAFKSSAFDGTNVFASDFGASGGFVTAATVVSDPGAGGEPAGLRVASQPTRPPQINAAAMITVAFEILEGIAMAYM